MKEAFEKIKEKLSERGTQQYEYVPILHETVLGRKIIAVEKALSIVSEVEAEYGNGWIPCSERLPEKCGVYLVSYKNTNCIPCATVFDGVQFLDKHVIAWMPLPEPYKPEKGV